MTKDERIKMIIEFATKVVDYPKGSKGYDPSDIINLKHHIRKYENEK